MEKIAWQEGKIIVNEIIRKLTRKLSEIELGIEKIINRR